MSEQVARAERFAALHRPGVAPLVLTNVWDAGSAAAVERAGCAAVGTSSWAMAAAQGYEDGERMPFEAVLCAVRAIVGAVRVPVTVDFERGYAEDMGAAGENLARLIEAGVVGVNFEDGLPGRAECRDPDAQARRIEGLRARAEATGVPVFLNARTDLFLNASAGEHRPLVARAKERGGLYERAGASGFFVPGLMDSVLVSEICQEVRLPVNVMVPDPEAPVGTLVASGVRRISRGPGAYIAVMAQLGRLASVSGPG